MKFEFYFGLLVDLYFFQLLINVKLLPSQRRPDCVQFPSQSRVQTSQNQSGLFIHWVSNETWSGQKRWQASFLWESEVQRTVTLWHHRVTLKSISSLIKEGYIINLCSFELKIWALSSLTGEKKNTDINSIFIYLSSSAVTTRHLIKLFSYWSLLLAIVCQMMSKCDI